MVFTDYTLPYHIRPQNFRSIGKKSLNPAFQVITRLPSITHSQSYKSYHQEHANATLTGTLRMATICY